MFNLEEKIVEWRKQMLAAGIQTPVPLEELENHLREDIERQMQSGVSEQTAFERASAQIGRAEPIKLEFKKVGGFLGWLGEDKTARTNRALALIWLAYCSWFFFMIAASLLTFFWGYKPRATPDLYLVLLYEFILLRVIIGNIRLFGGVIRDRRMIRMFALLGVVGGSVQIIIHAEFQSQQSFPVMVGVLIIFNLVSIWLLRPSRFEKQNLASN